MAERQQAELTREQEPHLIRVGLLQTAPTFGAIDDNLADISRLRASVADADLALTPELAANGYGFAPHPPTDLLQADDARLLALVRDGVGIGFAEQSPTGLPWNSYLMCDRTTGTATIQRKIHPVSYAPWNEHQIFQPGGSVAAAHLAGTRTATVICNDMWHPIVPWLAANSGAEILVVPVASMTGADPGRIKQTWATILEHAALMLQCYVVFINRSGSDSGVTFWGGSRVIGPDGAVISILDQNPAASVVELDLGALRQLRRDVPLLAESRVDFVRDAVARLTIAEETDV